MVFNATFNNIADIVAEETGLPGENHLPPQKIGKNKIFLRKIVIFHT